MKEVPSTRFRKNPFVGGSSAMARVGGIVLAAGLSTRMRRPKLLLKLDNESVIYKVVSSALFSRLDEVVLVTGEAHTQVLQSLHDFSGHRKLKIAHNKVPEAGMSSSIRTGMLALTEEKDGIMIILGDQARLTTNVIDHIEAVFSTSPSSIIAPMVRGRQTTPVVFPARFFPDLLSLTGDRGGRPILEANPDAVIAVEVGDMYDDMDIDTLEDWEKFTKDSCRS